jgi:hypothetical protein
MTEDRISHIPAETLAAALRDELAYLWDDLATQYRYSHAQPPENSMGCENLIERIHTITALVGPVSTDKIQIPFLLTGMYERVHRQIGIAATVPAETLERARAYVATSSTVTREPRCRDT